MIYENFFKTLYIKSDRENKNYVRNSIINKEGKI